MVRSISWNLIVRDTWEPAVRQTAFEDRLRHMLEEAHRSAGLLQRKAHTHNGYLHQNNTTADEVTGDAPPTLLRSASCHDPDDGTFEVPHFLERSSTFMRLRRPFKAGRGYNCPKLAAFNARDLHVWRQILSQDWRDMIGTDIDILFYINHCFDCEFHKEVVQSLVDLDANRGEFDGVITGDANAADINSLGLSGPGEEGHSGLVETSDADTAYHIWTCQVCQHDSPREAQFCVSCQTYRHDSTMWICPGTEKTQPSLPRHKKKACGQLMRMWDVRLGVPCCSSCGEVRYRAHEDVVFAFFCNRRPDVAVRPTGEETMVEPDEPRPQRNKNINGR